MNIKTKVGIVIIVLLYLIFFTSAGNIVSEGTKTLLGFSIIVLTIARMWFYIINTFLESGINKEKAKELEKELKYYKDLNTKRGDE